MKRFTTLLFLLSFCFLSQAQEKQTDDFDAEFNSDELIINGKRLPDNLLSKYKEMYKKHFGKEIEDGFRFRN